MTTSPPITRTRDPGLARVQDLAGLDPDSAVLRRRRRRDAEEGRHPGLIILAAAPVIWQLGRLAHHLPGRLELVTATIVAVALVALVVADPLGPAAARNPKS